MLKNPSQISNLSDSDSNVRSFLKVIDPRLRSKLHRVFKPYNPRFHILFDIYAGDIRVPVFLRRLVDIFRKEFPMSETDEDGVSISYPIESEFSKLLTYPGSIRLPLSFARHYVDDCRDQDFLRLLEANVKLVFSQSDMNYRGLISRDSSSGCPLFTNDLSQKIAHLRHVVDNLDIIKRVFKTDGVSISDREDIYKNLYILNVSTLQIRLQCDAWKEGKVKDREYISFTNLYFDKYLKSTTTNAGYNRGLANSRTRVVVAQPNVLNNLCSNLIEPYKQALYQRWPFTFKHRGGDDLVSKLSKFRYIQGCDVHQLDSNIPANLVWKLRDMYPFKPWVKSIIHDLIYCPWYVSDVDGSGKAYISESHAQKRFRTYKGNPSGIFDTSFFNNVLVSSTLYYELLRAGYLTCSYDVFLQGAGEVAACIMGDDLIIMSNIHNVRSIDFKNDILRFDLEERIRFLGHVFYRGKDNRLEWFFDPETFFRKRYIPEHQIGSKFRRLPYTGIKDAMSLHSKHPLFHKMLEVHNRLFREIFGREFMRVLQEYTDIEERNNVDLLNMNLDDISREVLLEPTKIYYKYDTSSVSKDVVDIICSRTPEDIFSKIIKEGLE